MRKMKFKKIKMSFFLVVSVVSLAALAQAVKEDINSSVGNGAAMKYNLNEPNATSPASNNIQHYEKDGVVRDKNKHPETNLSNSYSRISYQEKK